MPIHVDLDSKLAERGMTIARLADAIGLTPVNVYVLKSGRARAIRFSTLSALCEVLECSPGDLLTYSPDSEPSLARDQADP